LKAVHAEAEQQPGTLRISLDAKASVPIGPFSRKGFSRVKTKASDHDFKPISNLTPFGLLLPGLGELTFYMTPSKVTADFIVDRLEQWWLDNRQRFPLVTTLLLNLDNGPECHSRRSQFMQRLVEFTSKYRLTIQLAYYPPYHSKYNPIERCWGVLENYWNGNLMDSVKAVLGYASAMTWKSNHPVVKLVETVYQSGVRLTHKAMEAVEARIQRLPQLPKWFATISAPLF
jgi:hypothetical protein